MSSVAGRIFLTPRGHPKEQFWVNIGYDSFDGYQIPGYIKEFESICSREQYEDLMRDVELYFRRNARGSCCTLTVRHRPKFDEGLERVLVSHQMSSTKWKPGSKPKLAPWKPGAMLYGYGIPRNINPNCSYDSKGQPLIASVEIEGEFVDRPCWPPPYYNIVLNIPPRAAEKIRQIWPGENPIEKPRRNSFSLSMRSLSIFKSEPEETQI